MRSRVVVAVVVAAALVVAAAVVRLGPVREIVDGFTRDVRGGIVVGALPEPLRERVPDVVAAAGTACPALPPVWLAALAEARAAWDEPLEPLAERACSALAEVTPGLLRGRPAAAPLDAVVVCLATGCAAVGDAPPGGGIGRQVATARQAAAAWADPVGSPSADVGEVEGSAPLAFAGGDAGCVVDDPTVRRGGCLTPRAAHLLLQVTEHVHRGAVTCWDEHAWNPSSDHPRGRACDWTIGRIGREPSAAQVEQGWRLATWLRAWAEPLGVRYVIWQGRIWSARRDGEGWRPYDGGGVYDPGDVTGGHFDHVHVSVEE